LGLEALAITMVTVITILL